MGGVAPQRIPGPGTITARLLDLPFPAGCIGRGRGGGALLTPVPVHPDRRAARGYDQAELLARAAAATLGRPAVPALRRDRATAPQYELGRDRRAANVAAAFTGDPARQAVVGGRRTVL